MTTTDFNDSRTRLVRQLINFGTMAIVLAALATVVVFPRDPAPDWLDIVQEGAFALGGVGALWGAWRVNSPILTTGALLITMALAIDLADEFLLPIPVVDQWIPTALVTAGLGIFAWGLAEVAARDRAGQQKLAMSAREIERYQVELEAATAPAHLVAIGNDALELSRLESRRAVLTRENVDIARAADDAWSVVAGRAQAKWLDFSFDVPKSVGTIFTDSRRLKQMLIHLLDNAVKFTPSGGRIGLDVARDDHSGHILFTVWDSGPGIAAADHERVFQPFVQLNPSANRDPEGTGLGLTLVRRTARALGGEVWLTSEPGTGSRFTIALPVNPPRG